ncbi:SDR family NAD(P)-dependent oxidoreductase [Jiangella aurantiaca]|uniref:SDR family NAD(P)-dependent oxidoreductase n=1 Tax=Jiangella aurantiaca TaxID=2530373 RepID=A0A4R5APT5_9ACTN|nr:NAD(P)H-binding protein [Jiangella aurantiaca]TDD72342.1 SDR family NAD(P)-dependent oxidoreductase [Jiangella aurantiaca]
MTILLTGATGKVGRRVAARLDDLGVPARHAGRTSTPPFDWTDAATWPAMLDGVRSAFVVPYDGAQLTRPFVDAAIRSGVERIVLLSGRGVDVPDYLPAHLMEGNAHVDGEAALRPAAVDWTILRPGWFAQNFSEGFFRDAVLAGDLRLPAGDGAASFVDADDIAAVAVAALIDDGHVGQTYELSGPRALTMSEAVAEIAAATGRDVRYTHVEHGDFVRELVEQGWSEADAEEYAIAVSPIRRGIDAYLSDGVERALGRRARDFRDVVREAVDAGAWS